MSEWKLLAKAADAFRNCSDEELFVVGVHRDGLR